MWPFGSDPTLEIVPAGDVDDAATETIARAIDRRFRFSTEVSGEVPLDPRSYDPDREQYESREVLDYTATIAGADLTVLVLAEDLTLDDREYVFGSAAPDLGVVAMSTYRFREDDPSPDQFRDRVSKEALKLVARALTGETCAADPPNADGCVMRFAPTVRELDYAPETFCAACQDRLASDLD